jgi:hypothetical protein
MYHNSVCACPIYLESEDGLEVRMKIMSLEKSSSSCYLISGIALGYGLDDRGARVRFSVGAGNFSLHHRVQNGSGAHPASYPMSARGSFPGGKVAEAWS